MRTFTLAIMIVAAGLLIAGITGCSKTNEHLPPQTSTSDDAMGLELTNVNPDIGTLDDSPVSDEMPR